MRKFTAIFGSLLLVSAATAAVGDAATAIHCAHLIDTQAGKLLGETTVVMRDKRIESVVSGRQAPAGSIEIDLANETCLSRLIDSHTHLTYQASPTAYVDRFHWNIADYAVRSTVYARRTLLAGFTNVRNVGDQQNESVALRDAINAGILEGPRIFTVGIPIGSTGGHADRTNGYRTDLDYFALALLSCI